MFQLRQHDKPESDVFKLRVRRATQITWSPPDTRPRFKSLFRPFQLPMQHNRMDYITSNMRPPAIDSLALVAH